MKLNKIFSALFALVLAAGFTACTDEVDYTPAQKTPGYFFPVANTTPTQLQEVGGAFNLTIARVGITAAQTVNLAHINDVYGIPESVTFAENEETVTFSVSYAPELAPGVYADSIYTVGVPVTEYGLPGIKVTAAVPEPEPEVDWIELGLCTYTDPFVLAGLYGTFTDADDNKLKLTYQVMAAQDGSDENHYRIYAPYGTAFAKAVENITGGATLNDVFGDDVIYDEKDELYLDFYMIPGTKYVYMPFQGLGLSLDSDGEIYVMDYAYYYIMKNQSPTKDICATFKDGVLKYPDRTTLVNFADSPDEATAGKLYYGNTAFGNMKVLVTPNAITGDYSAEIEYSGQFNNAVNGTTTAIASFTFGKDVAAAKAGIIRSANAKQLISGIEEGTYDAVDIDLSNPTASFPLTAAGTHTIAVVTYDEDGEAQESTKTTIDVAFYGDDKAWKDLGNATIADGWIIPFFMDKDETPVDYAYELPIQESKSNPGLYRIKNMWGAGSPLGSANQADSSADLYIDATDPECILIMPQYSGFDFYPYLGSVMVANLEGFYYNNGYSKADITELDEDGENLVTTYIEDDCIIVDGAMLGGNGSLVGGKWFFMDVAQILLPDAEDTPAEIRATNKAVRNATIKNRKFKSSFKIARKGNEATGVHAKKSSSLSGLSK